MLKIFLWWLGSEWSHFRDRPNGESAPIQYFAYGANMDPEVLRERRIHAFASEPYVLDGFRLTFNHRGPFPESGYGHIERHPESKVYGWLHTISAQDARKLDYSELRPVFHRYRRSYLYPDQGEGFYFYQSNLAKSGLKPTRDYLHKIVRGLKKHPAVPAAYLQKLSSTPVADTKVIDTLEYQLLTHSQPSRWQGLWSVVFVRWIRPKIATRLADRGKL